MATQVSSSDPQVEAVRKVSLLNRLCEDSQLSNKVVSITLIVIGIILIVSGILLLSFSAPALPASLSIAFGAAVIGVGSALFALGLAKRIMKPSTAEADNTLAQELLGVRELSQKQLEEYEKVQVDLTEAQRQLGELQTRTLELENQLETERTEKRDLENRLQVGEESVRALTRQELETLQESLNQKNLELQRMQEDAAVLAQQHAGTLNTLTREQDRCVEAYKEKLRRKTEELAETQAQLTAALQALAQIQSQISGTTPPRGPVPGGLVRSASSLSLNLGGGPSTPSGTPKTPLKSRLANFLGSVRRGTSSTPTTTPSESSTRSSSVSSTSSDHSGSGQQDEQRDQDDPQEGEATTPVLDECEEAIDVVDSQQGAH
ncbi:hypothetical protein [Chlamydia vaughanii]|uniref:hypothetical protein n=1 Tax=Chlamydia vaughanii TaxID=3112552 RepID=UPI0032B11EBE